MSSTATFITAAALEAAAAIERTLSAVQTTAAHGLSTLVAQGLARMPQTVLLVVKPVVCAVTVTVAGAVLLAGSVGAGLAQSAREVGEIAPRPDSGQVESALSALKTVQAEIPKRCANLAAQADPLSGAISAYRADPSPENAIRLLRQEAVIASVGSADCEKIGVEAGRAAGVCKDLAASCASDAAALLPDLERSTARLGEFNSAKASGIDGLRRLHVELRRRGITNDSQLLLQLSRQERGRIASLLRLTGAAELSERFSRMDATATEQVRGELVKMTKAFEDKETSFRELAESYRTHANSFRVVAASVAHVSSMVELGQRNRQELDTAHEIEAALRDTDQAISTTLEEMPADIDLGSSLAGSSTASKPAETGLFKRLLRFLGLGHGDSSSQVTTLTATP